MNRFTSHHDRLHLAIRSGALAVLVIIVLWYLQPASPQPELEVGQVRLVPDGVTENTTPGSGRLVVKESMFNVELWHTPVAVPPIQARPIAKPARFNIQLVAIIADELTGRDAAVFYDPELDEMRRVHIGSQIGGLDVRDITHDAVELGSTARSQRIELELLEIDQ